MGWEPIRETVLERRVPKTPWYFGDGAALFLLLMVLVVTGSMMALSYSPTPDAAYESVQRITDEQPMGWFVRALHYWAAGLMVVVLYGHLFRQILFAGYKAPREGTWLIGVVMFFLVHVMAFTGYILRWDERAIHGLQVALHMFSRIPLIGEELVILVQGDEFVGGAALTRLFAVHVIIVPLLLLGLAFYHLYLVILHGTFTPLEHVVPIDSAKMQKRLYERQARSEELGETFHPEASTDSGAMALALVLVAIVLALTLGPRELMAPASLHERSFPAEEWWFWWYSGLIGLLPPWAAPWVPVALPIALFLGLALLPFVDRRPYRGLRKRPIAVTAVVLSVLALLFLSDVRRRSPWLAWPDHDPPPVPAGVTLPPEAEHGRQLFAALGCNTCHAVAGHGPPFGPDLARLPEPRSRGFMRDFILQPPTGAAMPAYAGRIDAQELEELLDFVHAAQMFPLR